MGPQVTLTNRVGRIIFDQRYRFEFRYLGHKVDDNSNGINYTLGLDFLEINQKMRFRYFLRAIIPLGNHKKLENNTFYIIAWNEMFIGLGKNTNNDKIWDQNRSFCLLGYKPEMHFPMRFEVGYGLQYANRFVSNFSNGILTETEHRTESNHLLQVYVIFEDFNKLFASDSDQQK